MAKFILHEVGEQPRTFATLNKALLFAADSKTTGYIAYRVGTDSGVINLKKGKRPGVKAGTWVRCDAGYR